MVHSRNIDMKEWKKEQLRYFKKFLSTFEVGSSEYLLLKKRIDELENMP